MLSEANGTAETDALALIEHIETALVELLREPNSGARTPAINAHVLQHLNFASFSGAFFSHMRMRIGPRVCPNTRPRSLHTTRFVP